MFADGRWDERHLCHAPQERLFLHGRWQAGFEPQVGPTARDRDQVARFEQPHGGVRRHRRIHRADGRRGRRHAARRRSRWRSGCRSEGLDSPWLRWLVDYACRDDYGARAGDTAAWAGIHYFASRAPQEPGPLTWPEGNGWITRRLLAMAGDRVKTGPGRHARRRARARAGRSSTPDARWIGRRRDLRRAVVSGGARDRGGPATPDFQYSPWLTANLTLDRWPAERGAPVAWDNVIVDSPSLGYVVATHQSLRTHVPRTVWTYYWALADGPPRVNREWLLAQDWRSLTDADSRRPVARASRHPRVREPHRHLPDGPRDDPAHARLPVVARPPQPARARRPALLRALRRQRPLALRGGAVPRRRRRRPRDW